MACRVHVGRSALFPEFADDLRFEFVPVGDCFGDADLDGVECSAHALHDAVFHFFEVLLQFGVHAGVASPEFRREKPLTSRAWFAESRGSANKYQSAVCVSATPANTLFVLWRQDLGSSSSIASDPSTDEEAISLFT